MKQEYESKIMKHVILVLVSKRIINLLATSGLILLGMHWLLPVSDLRELVLQSGSILSLLSFGLIFSRDLFRKVVENRGYAARVREFQNNRTKKSAIEKGELLLRFIVEAEDFEDYAANMEERHEADGQKFNPFWADVIYYWTLVRHVYVRVKKELLDLVEVLKIAR